MTDQSICAHLRAIAEKAADWPELLAIIEQAQAIAGCAPGIETQGSEDDSGGTGHPPGGG